MKIEDPFVKEIAEIWSDTFFEGSSIKRSFSRLYLCYKIH